MNKPFLLALFGLAALLGNLRHPAGAEQPEKAKKQSDLRRSLFLNAHLRAMKEPWLWRLAEKDRTAVAYRFLWLPSFHNPISVRFVKSDDGIVLHAVRLNGMGGYEPGTIAARESVKLSPGHWAPIASDLEKAKFWTLPTFRRPKAKDGIDMHGDRLIVEGVSDGKYHIVARDNPRGGDFVDLCGAMLFMSGIDVRHDWFDYRR